MRSDWRERPSIQDILSLDIVQTSAKKFGILLEKNYTPKTLQQIIEERKKEIQDQEIQYMKNKKMEEEFKGYQEDKEFDDQNHQDNEEQEFKE